VTVATLPEKIPNYMFQSVLVTLLCCLPVGIAAIVYAAQVNSRMQMGDYQGAWHASKKAKMWAWIGFAWGIILWSLIATIAVSDNH
jgi:hypothetical protein